MNMQTAQLEFVRFDSADVITTSNPNYATIWIGGLGSDKTYGGAPYKIFKDVQDGLDVTSEYDPATLKLLSSLNPGYHAVSTLEEVTAQNLLDNYNIEDGTYTFDSQKSGSSGNSLYLPQLPQ